MKLISIFEEILPFTWEYTREHEYTYFRHPVDEKIKEGNSLKVETTLHAEDSDIEVVELIVKGRVA